MIVIREGQDPVQVESGANPFQVCILSACLLWGVVALAALGRISGSSTRTIPIGGVYCFFAFLAAGSAVALLGVAYELRQKLLGFYVERAGLLTLVGLCIAYSLWAVAASGARATGFVLIMGAVWVASLLRIRRIRADLKKVAAKDDPT